MAAVCLSVCMPTCLSASEGQCCAAIATCLTTSLRAASRLRGVPEGPGKRGLAGPPPRSASQLLMSATVTLVRGTARSLRPLPALRISA